MLIANASNRRGERIDVRIDGDRIAAIDRQLKPAAQEDVIDARGGLLLPGLHDHQIHLQALAAARASVTCGPPAVNNAEELARSLRQADTDLPAGQWLRGVAYHESVAGELDCKVLDALLPGRPVRIQHRSGRLWLFNSAALRELTRDGGDTPLELRDGRPSGRLYDADAWLRARLPGQRPDLAAISRELAGYGITGVTDTSHDNDKAALAWFAKQQATGALRQRLRVMGNAELDDVETCEGTRLTRGQHKFHLHEHELPDFDELCAAIRISHAAGRRVAFHCVTRTELVYALQALREVGSSVMDRIEHASITPPELLDDMQTLGVSVVTQPNFVAERGDAYLRDVEPQELPNLYRLQSFRAAGIPLAAGSDAPYGDPSPWAAMQAAVLRRTANGKILGGEEALTPEQALALFLAPLDAPGGPARTLKVGVQADLCLLTQPWQVVRAALSQVSVRAVFSDGQLVA